MERFAPWVRIYADIINHPKTLGLRDTLKCSHNEAVGIIIRLILWWAQYCPGSVTVTSRVASHLHDVNCYTLDDPADHMERWWHELAGEQILDAMVKVGWLDPQGETEIALHNYAEYLGALEVAREGGAERSRVYRAKIKATRSAEISNSHVTVTSPSRHVQDKIIEDKKREKEDTPPAPQGGSAASILASAYRNSVGKPLSQEKAITHVQAALSVGVPAQRIEQAFMDPANRGKDIWTILDPLRAGAEKSKAIQSRPPIPKQVKCFVCNDSGLTGGGVENGKVLMIPCSCKRKALA